MGKVGRLYFLDEERIPPTECVSGHLLRVFLELRGGMKRLERDLMSTEGSVLATNLEVREWFI